MNIDGNQRDTRIRRSVSEYQFGLGIGDDVLTFERAGVRRDRDHGNTGDQCAGDGDHCLEAGGGLYCHSLCTMDSIGDRGGGGKQVGAREGCAFAETDRRSVIVEDAGVEGAQKCGFAVHREFPFFERRFRRTREQRTAARRESASPP